MRQQLRLETNVDLQPLNTLAIAARAAYFVRVESLEQLREALAFAQEKKLPILPLGGGSNIVLTGDYPGLVIHMALRGVSLEKDSCGTRLCAAAGENWHQLVMHTVKQGIGGLENLALIPGSMGAAPIQNIGAYGVELRDTFECLQAVHIASGELREFPAADCQFGYRDSVFKRAARDRYIITRVSLYLPNDWRPKLDYPALERHLAERGVQTGELRPADVARAVIEIRNSKLPSPDDIPNVGSFFKNPVVGADFYQNLKKSYPDLVAFPSGDGWKLAAGWLIDRAGWRGVRRNSVGVHDRQALVLVNPGGGCGAEVTSLAEEIAADIRAKFGVDLEPEPRYYP
ncbi:UDP-N-acetylmuramate dehydrogenase [Microbulbifer thermotolerans]|uniref:UDP-N-acetylmuramate dehydrogenase n=1 Tax=Microbulbifer thermotolerans TaxID=252514 RepID=UPI002248A664|nr:UDP-N-acetylmuramate dehydrogenase [Microbulbifer thermotolerans]MCX2782312.1 UDP-N-acetylmuramate dehydrogenase [Microbulbifer thermotolerans]MCX2831089.1 UDP-N-acetylmuramate dehydrogenase [Microbulbifer thermotolerans]MCX2833573.1 UDP-N-acetylmuramate dehydrogenase [Microbulbifer thermotolerans]